MSKYIKPTHTVHPELLLLFVFTINRKKMKRRGSERNKKWGKCSVRESVLHCKQNQGEIQHNLRTEGERGTCRHSFFTVCEAKLITVSFNSRKKGYFKAQQDTLDTTCGVLQDSSIDQNIKSEDSELQNKQTNNQNKQTNKKQERKRKY